MQSSHGHRHLMCRLHYRRSVTVGNFCTNVQSPGHASYASLLTNRLSQATVGCLLLAYSFSPRVHSIPRGPLIYVLQGHTLMLDI